MGCCVTVVQDISEDTLGVLVFSFGCSVIAEIPLSWMGADKMNEDVARTWELEL